MDEISTQPYMLKAGPVGILLIHGFTASPTELRPIADALFQNDYSALGIRLAGHGTHVEDLHSTSWRDWLESARSGLDKLSAHCKQVCVIGLSMGGVLAARLAAEHPQQVHGVCLLAPAFRIQSKFLWLASSLKHIVPAIAKGPQSLAYYQKHQLFAYDAMPVAALAQLHALIKTTTPLLPQVHQPTALFMGMRDHTVVAKSGQTVWKSLGSAEKKLVHLPHSGHIVSVEPDAPYLVQNILQFLEHTLRR